MPKMKTHKGTAKRFALTGTAKLIRARSNKSHLRRKKTGRTKREFDEMFSVSTPDRRRIKRLLPYGV
ncbi:MAG: 50S ribosomal protein L35 [Chloroflexi bacterium]|nr:50S ribosomal protein L35 [Chloroflexota bacterium]MCL5076437.1 50S ribosomal protein L35 [Chloroflexota bacterium]